MIISQGQVASLVALHLIRLWPTMLPPNLEHILKEWVKHTSRDFDTFGILEIPDKELRSYLAITLNQDCVFKAMMNEIDSPAFYTALNDSIKAEIKELVEL